MSNAEQNALDAFSSVINGEEFSGELPVPKKLLSVPKLYQIIGICTVSGTKVPAGLNDLVQEKEGTRHQSYPEELRG